MKYLIILGDGMSDLPDSDGATPLTLAKKPIMDSLCKAGESGLVQTVPKGMKPGSDNANLSVLGYDPKIYYTGRSPLEALSMGIELADTDITYRCNLVTLSDEEQYENKTMLDYSAGEISSGEAAVLISYLSENLDLSGCRLYAGVSYRHCLVMPDGKPGAENTPPHDISDKKITSHMPCGENGGFFSRLQKDSYDLLKNHPVNIDRIRKGKNPANSMWFWGEGKKPVLTPFLEKFGLKGAMISAVDLLKGIAAAASMTVCEVAGATGNIDTDYEGKAQAALNVLSDHDFVYVHVEASDECGHKGDKENKIRAIEYLDSRLIKPITESLISSGQDFSMLILPDHATPLALKTHTSDPVPYILYRSTEHRNGAEVYSESAAAQSGLFYSAGHELILKLFQKTKNNT